MGGEFQEITFGDLGKVVTGKTPSTRILVGEYPLLHHVT